MYRMEKLVPLIGPTVAGPLWCGALLPRTWLKSVLSAPRGMLWAGYFDNDKGFNHRVVEDLGLEPEPFCVLGDDADLSAGRGLRQSARDQARSPPIDRRAQHQHRESFQRPEETALAPFATRVGHRRMPNFRNSAMLLDLDDWFTMHSKSSRIAPTSIEPLVPMVSSRPSRHLAGIPHLPRLWIKAPLDAVRRAHRRIGRPDLVCGFDKKFADRSASILRDRPRTSATPNCPNYLEFERWVRDHIAAARRRDESPVGFTAILSEAERRRTRRRGAHRGRRSRTGRSAGTVLLDDMVDWKHMYDHIVSQRVVRA